MATDSQGNEIGKLFVGGLQQQTSNENLKSYFMKFGDVEDAIVMMDNNTQRSRGFGYVKFVDAHSVEKVMGAKPHILDDKEIDPKPCNINMKGKNKRSLKVFVGGIAPEVNEETVKEFFSQYGVVTDVNLMIDPAKQRHRGFAFVGFDDEDTVKRLISMHFLTLANKQVEIKAMEPPNSNRRQQQMPYGMMNSMGLSMNQNGHRGGGRMQNNRYNGGNHSGQNQFPAHLFFNGPSGPGDYHQQLSNLAAAANSNGTFGNSSVLGHNGLPANFGLWGNQNPQNLVNNWHNNPGPPSGINNLSLSSMSAALNHQNGSASGQHNAGNQSMQLWPHTDNRFGGAAGPNGNQVSTQVNSNSYAWNEYLASLGMMPSGMDASAAAQGGMNNNGTASSVAGHAQWNMWNESRMSGQQMNNNHAFNSNMASNFGQSASGQAPQNSANNRGEWRANNIAAPQSVQHSTLTATAAYNL